MSRTQRRRSVSIEYDGIVGLGDLEEAALAFARSAPGELVAEAIESMVADLVDTVVGPFGVPWPVSEQLEAPWACTGCGSRRGFRRRGFRPKPRTITTAAGKVAFRSQQLECLSCSRRFAPAAELLGLRPHQRRTEALSELASALAVEVAYAKSARLLMELAGVALSARSIRRDVLTRAPQRLGPEVTKVPILLLDGTGERAGPTKGGVALHLAIGLVARSRQGRRVRVEAVLLGATVGEGWDVMAGLLAGVAPGLIVVDGEAELSAMAAEVSPGCPCSAVCGTWPGASTELPATTTRRPMTWPTASDLSSRPCCAAPTSTVTSTPPAPPTTCSSTTPRDAGPGLRPRTCAPPPTRPSPS